MSDERSDLPKQAELKYFKQILSSHDRVESYTEIGGQQFEIERKNFSHGAVKVYLSGLYTIGIADCMDIIQLYPDVNCIVTSSVWNGYTQDAKDHAKSLQIGLFVLNEFMGALHKDDFWNYFKRDNQGKPINFSRRSDS